MEEPERREEQHRFRKGQIVAVRQEEQDRWVPAAYQATVEDDYDRRFKARRLGYATFGVRWRYCVPAQEVWPWMEKLRARIVIEEKEYMTEADEATAKAIRCRRAMWGGQPCTPRGDCPFDRKPPQRPSEMHCEDVTPEMWADAMQSKRLAQSLKSLAFFIGGTHVAGWVEEAERAAREGRMVDFEGGRAWRLTRA